MWAPRRTAGENGRATVRQASAARPGQWGANAPREGARVWPRKPEGGALRGGGKGQRRRVQTATPRLDTAAAAAVAPPATAPSPCWDATIPPARVDGRRTRVAPRGGRGRVRPPRPRRGAPPATSAQPPRGRRGTAAPRAVPTPPPCRPPAARAAPPRPPRSRPPASPRAAGRRRPPPHRPFATNRPACPPPATRGVLASGSPPPTAAASPTPPPRPGGCQTRPVTPKNGPPPG